MKIARLPSADIHWREDGDPDGTPVVFANSLGTELRLWDKVIDLLPETGLRLIRFDKRGHGLSSCPESPYSMDDLASDTQQLLDHLQIGSCVFVGLSIGGMIGQLLSHRQPERIKGLVLSNTGAKMGEAAMWQDRIARIRAGGIESLADAILERWFSEDFRQTAECLAWRHMLVRTPTEGYIGCCEAIAGADLTTARPGFACRCWVSAAARTSPAHRPWCAARRTSSPAAVTLKFPVRAICPASKSRMSLPAIS